MELLVGVLLGLCIGLVLGTIGAGGSVLAVPALIFIADLSVQEATGTALIIVGASAALGFFLNLRAGRTRVRVGLALGGMGIAGAVLGSWLHVQAPEKVILLLLALVVLVAATIVYLRIPKEDTKGNPALEHSPTWLPKVITTGAALGILTGFFGVGGGFLIVPTLVLVLGLPMSLAVGTSLLVIAMNSVSGIIGHLGFGELGFENGWPILIGALAGSATGTRLGARLREKGLRTIFAVVLYGVAVLMLVDVIRDLASG